MNIGYNKFIKILHLYSPTQNLIVFRALYSESKTDKYKPIQVAVNTKLTHNYYYLLCKPSCTAPGRRLPEASFDYYEKVRVWCNREFHGLPDTL